ncbi:MAG TPA: sigma-70 family RNA polymerase sigma factor [Candidatus Sulfotelmatobacter sp.]|jgi:DNA-directed RNA polymerase specialized sigma24 family protein|nr:sigma-70 family RNA polymerase sigma factor [Candidatus Sulfotelmatobacter sp.]
MIRQRDSSSRSIPSQPGSTGASAEPAQLFQLTMLHALLLPPRCRDVYVLKEIHGYTPAEIANALGLSTTEVKRHLRRAYREMGET